MKINTRIGLIFYHTSDIHAFLKEYNLSWKEDITNNSGEPIAVGAEIYSRRYSSFKIQKIIHEPLLDINVIFNVQVHIGAFIDTGFHVHNWAGYEFSEIIFNEEIIRKKDIIIDSYIQYLMCRVRGDYDTHFILPSETKMFKSCNIFCHPKNSFKKVSLFENIVLQWNLSHIFQDISNPSRDEINLFKLISGIV